MTLLLVSFLAGTLTVLAPCILPLLPVIIGGSSARSSENKHDIMRRAFLITSSLAISVVVFTLILKATTALLGIPQEVWQVVSGTIVMLLGINFLFPHLWLIAAEKISLGSNKALFGAASKPGVTGQILTGAALGPVFTSCSPTYALILAAVLPVSFATGFTYLVAYALGMALVLLIASYYGARLTQHLGWTLDETGWFRRTLGIIFVIVGLSVMLGFDKDLQTWLLERGFYDGTSGLERYF